MAKSPNKHNRLYAQAASLGDKLPENTGANLLVDTTKGV